MSGFVHCWNRFFFREVDARVYVFLRISVGIILAIYMIVLGPDWLRWFSEAGVLDSEAARANIDSDTWSVFHWIPNENVLLWFVFGAICLQVVLLVAGIKPRFQVICLFVWFLSMHHRNNLIWEGGDVLLRITLFLMMFMPLSGGFRSAKGVTRPIWPLLLLQIQQSILYLSSVGQKLKGADWRDGTAVYYASRLDDFSGRLLSFPISPNHLWISQLASWMTLAVELLLAFAVWVPSMWRQTVLIGIAFHLALELSMNLFLFQWLMVFILSTHLFVSRKASEGWSACDRAPR